MPTDDPAFAAAERDVTAQVNRFLSIGGTKSPDHFHKELGKIMWEYCGMARNEAGLRKALTEIPALREEFDKDLRVLGTGDSINQSLEKAGRVADFLELGELMCRDALERNESCGGHFREESQTDEGEALRRDDEFSFVVGLGVDRRPVPRPAAQGTARIRERRADAALVQVRKTDPMKLKLNIWRQATPDATGAMQTYEMDDVSPEMSFLEMLDVLNEELIAEGEEPVEFEHDCREGICGSCGADDQRPGPRPPEGHGHLPAPHAQVRRRRRRSTSSRGGPPRSPC